MSDFEALLMIGSHFFKARCFRPSMGRYRKYVYETGAIKLPGKNSAQTLNEKIIGKERKKDYELSRVDRFIYRTRYFTDSGIIGSKKFVAENYLRFKDLFQSKEKKPKPVKGLDGIYSLKRLVET